VVSVNERLAPGLGRVVLAITQKVVSYAVSS
jgi:hypothetical protein